MHCLWVLTYEPWFTVSCTELSTFKINKKYIFQLQIASVNSSRSEEKIVAIDLVANPTVVQKWCIHGNLICFRCSITMVSNLCAKNASQASAKLRLDTEIQGCGVKIKISRREKKLMDESMSLLCRQRRL